MRGSFIKKKAEARLQEVVRSQSQKCMTNELCNNYMTKTTLITYRDLDSTKPNIGVNIFFRSVSS